MSSWSRRSVVVAVALAVASAAAAESLWVPVAAHVPGVGSSQWRTDLAVLNPCPAAASVELVLHVPSGAVTVRRDLSGGEQLVLEDVVAGLTAAEVAAALEVRSEAALTVSSRTYAAAAAGTFGQSLDGVAAADGLGSGEAALLPQLREDPGYRCNVGVLNMGDEAATVSVTLLDRLGREVGSFELEVPPGQTVQDNRPYLERFGRGDVVGGWARVEVESGAGVWPYASVVDNSTDDPTTVLPRAVPACPVDVADRLAAIPGLTALERATSQPGYRYFMLFFDQPEDHARPDGPTFRQYLTLLHRAEDAPMVLETEGYQNTWRDTRAELTQMLDANQLVVEHRFFGMSRPSSGDWSLLTIEQAAADHHRVVEALRAVYAGPWVSTGHSKGGMTAVYHRRFYPDDVDATVPYVAPISFGAPDERYPPFLAAAGTPACNQALWAVQREALGRREAMLDLLAQSSSGLSFDRIGGQEAAFESVVVELPFTFWQYAGEGYCGQVPGTSASDQAIFSFLDDFVGFWYASDAVFDFFEPYYYQAHAQLGYPAVATDHIADLLVVDPADLEAGLLPAGTDPTYDPLAMADIAEWVATEGSRLLFVYGQYDPWTAGAFALGGAVDSYLFVEPGGTHGALIGTLAGADQAQALAIVERWTGVTPVPAAAPKGRDLFPPWRRQLPAGAASDRAGGGADS